MAKLTDTRCRTLKAPGEYCDSGCTGLILRVTPALTKSWMFRAVIGGKRRKLGLGAYPAVSLQEARKRAEVNREQIASGLDPMAEKRKAEAMAAIPTFAEASAKAVDVRFSDWQSNAHAIEWMGSLQRHAFPKLGTMTVDTIQASDVLSALLPIWDEIPVTAAHVRNRISAVMAWSVSHGFRDINPCLNLAGALPTQKRAPVHHRALDHADMPDAMAAIDGCSAMLPARLALQFAILTAARSGEARAATWAEIDMEAAIWSIPGERMKSGIAHSVPLSPAALDVLREAMPLRNESGLCFPSARTGKVMAAIALQGVLKAAGLHDRATIHGMRACFRTWGEEATHTSIAVMEEALAHCRGSKTERAYARSDLLAKRRTLMDQWATFCTAPAEAKVIPFPIAATG